MNGAAVRDGPGTSADDASFGVLPRDRRWPVCARVGCALLGIGGGLGVLLSGALWPWPLAAAGAVLAAAVALAAEALLQNRRVARLRHSEQRLRDLARASNDWHWEIDADLRFTYLSPGFETAFGFSPDRLVGRRREEVAGPDTDPEALAAHIADMEARRPFRDFVYRLQRADGSPAWCRVSGIPVYDADRRFAGYRGSASDVSARHLAEERVERTRARLRELTDNVPGAVYQYQRDADGSIRFNFMSAGIAELYGVTAEAVMADPTLAFQLIHPEDHDALVASIDEAYANAAAWFYEYRIVVDGRTKWVRGQSQPQDLGGGTMVWNGLLTDITELKRAEAALREQQNRYARAVRGSQDGLWDYCVRSGEVYYSSRFHELLGLPPDTLGTRPEAFLERIHPADASAVRPHIRQHIRDQTPYDIELRARTGDGAYRWYRLRAETERDAQDRALRMAGTLSDISDLKAQERELVRAREHAEAANKSKAEFLASMSHELRTPLNAIIGFSEVLESQLLGPLGSARYRDYAGDIRESGAHLLSLINDILDHAKIEAGRRELHEEWLELPELVAATLRLVKERAAARGVALSVDLPADLPRLYADQRAVKQILINLLTNAVKFTESGGSVTVSTQAGDNLMLEVQDTGIGIAAADVEQVMAPFGQADNTLTREYEGTGLGLTLCRQLCLLHGGELRLESTPGKGTRVTVQLPGARLERTGADAAAPKVSAG